MKKIKGAPKPKNRLRQNVKGRQALEALQLQEDKLTRKKEGNSIRPIRAPRNTSKRLSEEQRAELRKMLVKTVRARVGALTIQELAVKFGVHPNTIRHHHQRVRADLAD